jgi:hypothetical protein
MKCSTLSILATGVALAVMDGCAASTPSPRTEAVLTPVSPPPRTVSPPPVSPTQAAVPPDPPPSRPTTPDSQMVRMLSESAAGTGAGTGSEAFGAGGIGTPTTPSGWSGAPGAPGAPKIREGKVMVNGPLPPEVIQRIARQRFGAYRVCYEAGLRKRASLNGQVVVHFVIDTSGSVSMPERNPTTTMRDDDVVSCVMQSVATLSFPQPQGGTVDVVYSLMFSP